MQPGSASNPLGTDELGRDVMLRLLYGGRISLSTGLTAACVAATIGTVIGLCAGYFGGRLDALLMRLTDGVIALPLLPLLIVLAAHGIGASHLHIMYNHILPNLISTIIVAVTLFIGNVILLESVLSFLGLGIQPPMPSWGNMLTNAQNLIWEAPMLAVYPGMLIFITVISFNFLADGLQDALDPRAEY